MKMNIRTPSYWQDAIDYLTDNDAVLADIIAQYKGETLISKGDAFATLARSIAGQQISVKAADAIWKKLEQQLRAVEPEEVLALADEPFRACGFSMQKMNYMRNIATYFKENKHYIESWHVEEDEHIIDALTSIKGVGRWTAEMFLIFYLLKPDVFPLDDIGVLKAIAKHYKNSKPYKEIKKLEYLKLATKWQPYRTVATWYLWRSLDPHPVEY